MDAVLEKIKNIASKYKTIQKVVLFGSRARGDNTPASDYDIALFAEGISAEDKTCFLEEIEEIETLHKIDALWVQPRHKETEIYQNILREGIEIMNKFENKLSNFQNAVNRLQEGLDEAKENPSLTVRDGVIQRFEFTAELAWKTVREYLISQEIGELNSPKAVLAEGFRNGLINDENGWLQILRDRNSTSHIYDEAEAGEIFGRISTQYIELFGALVEKFNTMT